MAACFFPSFITQLSVLSTVKSRPTGFAYSAQTECLRERKKRTGSIVSLNNGKTKSSPGTQDMVRLVVYTLQTLQATVAAIGLAKPTSLKRQTKRFYVRRA